MGVAVDSNILVRFFTKDNAELTARAIKIINEGYKSQIILDRIILAEFGYVLRSYYGYSKDKVSRLYGGLMNDERFSLIDRELVELTVDLFTAETSLSFEDCWLLALKRAGKVKDIATFDENLAKRT